MLSPVFRVQVQTLTEPGGPPAERQASEPEWVAVLSRGRKRRREPLTRGKIMRAALAYVDEHGLEALTIRNLAASLGVAPMSIYGHVRNKGEILTGIGEILLDGMAPPPAEGSWRDRITALAHSYRAVLIQHRNALPVNSAQDLEVIAIKTIELYTSRASGGPPENQETGSGRQLLHAFDVALGIFCDLGLDVGEAFLALSALIFFTRGLVVFEIRFLEIAEDAGEFLEQANALRQLLQSLPESVAPSLVALAPYMGRLTPWDFFEYGLARFLDGIEAHINETVGGSEPKT